MLEKSASIKELAAALNLFQVKMEKIAKDSNNPFFKSKYASLSTILEHIQTPLAECDLSFTQCPVGDNGLVTLLMHAKSGEYIQSEYTMKPVKDDPQGRGSSITYQRRYALTSVLGLNIDEDDDANAASTPTAQPKQQATDDKPWLNKDTDTFKKVVYAITEGKATIVDVRKKYKISKEVEQEITNEVGKK